MAGDVQEGAEMSMGNQSGVEDEAVGRDMAVEHFGHIIEFGHESMSQIPICRFCNRDLTEREVAAVRAGWATDATPPSVWDRIMGGVADYLGVIRDTSLVDLGLHGDEHLESERDEKQRDAGGRSQDIASVGDAGNSGRVLPQSEVGRWVRELRGEDTPLDSLENALAIVEAAGDVAQATLELRRAREAGGIEVAPTLAGLRVEAANVVLAALLLAEDEGFDLTDAVLARWREVSR